MSAPDSALGDARSLRRQLIAWLLGPVTLIALLASAIGWYAALRFANDVYDRWISDNAVALSQLVHSDGGGVRIDLPPEAEHMLGADQRDRIYWRLSTLEGGFIAGHRGLPAPDAPVPGVAPRCFDGRFGESAVRVAVYRPAQQPVVVTVAETVDKRDRLASEILAGVILPMLLILGLSAAGILAGVDRGLRPLRSFAAMIAARAPGSREPIALRDVPDEVRPLSAALNQLLQRLDAALETQRRFVADAAHQLRTPLAGLKTQAELGLRARDPAEMRAALETVASATGRTARLVTQLLSLARAEPDQGMPHAAEEVDLAALARAVAAGDTPRALEKGIDLGYEGAQRAAVRGDPVMLRELLANLVDNALAYCPRGAMVTVAVTAEGPGTTLLSVTDNGPGIAEPERERVFERFHRVSGSPGEGSGLGLAIAREIASAHGATIALGPGGNAQGTRVEVRFAAPPG
ncbi:MAG: sensor histidine kinase N-terminal domain-containing protein [Betaproteobacteria bacterium]